MKAMMLFSANGPRAIPDERVLFVYRDRVMGRYCQATFCLDSGEEVSGLVLVVALDALEAKLDDDAPPPMAA
jgi:hypothetical protein